MIIRTIIHHTKELYITQGNVLLTKSDAMETIRCSRGHGLLCAGKNRIAIEVRASVTEFDLITADRESLVKLKK